MPEASFVLIFYENRMAETFRAYMRLQSYKMLERQAQKTNAIKIIRDDILIDYYSLGEKVYDVFLL